MKNTIYKYISSTCVLYTAVMLFNSLFNCFLTDSQSENNIFWQSTLLFLFAICIIQLISFGINRWDFKSNLTYHIVNYLSTCISSFLIFYFTGIIISFSMTSLISYTISYTIIYLLLYYYFRQNYQLQADEINEMLKQYKEHL